MIKKLLNILLLLIISMNLFAKEITKKNVAEFANNWLKENNSFLKYGEFKKSDIQFRVRTIESIINVDSTTVMYVVDLLPKGFLLISTDDRLLPVIGYSSEKNFNFDKKADDSFIQAIVKSLDENIGRIEKENYTTINSEWKKYLSANLSTNSDKEIKEIYGPFLNSDWGQGFVNGRPVYNYYTPNQWPVGCVATATAQILNYYKWPYQGNDYHGYSDDGNYLSANFGETFYDWENTLDLYSNQYFNTDNQKAAGLLVYHCAVALEMDFEYNGSTASTSDVPGILHDYFRASGHYESVTSSGFWDEMKNNMLDERPAIVSIKASSNNAGHAAVVDGYFETNNYYHLNPGWYGDYIGWYNISGDWYMSGYNIVVGATKGIVPSPQINEIEIINDNSFIISWRTSKNQQADYYELQQARSLDDTWVTISSDIPDTLFTIENADMGSYYYKVRAYRNNIWWDYSEIKKVQLGAEREVTFQLDMTYRPLVEGDSVVIRGNTPPLVGNINSAAMVKEDSTNIYQLTLNFDYDYVGQTIIYRYFIQSSSSLIAEGKNREYVLTPELEQVLPVVYFDDLVSVEDIKNTPIKFSLEQNYPNPFNPSTTINYSIPVPNLYNELSKNVVLKVYDILGNEVATLVNEKQSSGNYSVTFDASNLTTGIYFYKLQNEFSIETKKMILIK